MIEAYCKLNQLGIAKSVEVWEEDELVGGLYGVDLGTILDNGESKWKYSEVEQRKLDIKYYNKAIEYVKILFK